MRKRNALTRLMLIGFRAAHNEPATEEFLVVQFLHSAFRFLDGLHLHKRKTFRALVVPIAYDLGVMHVADAIEQVEEIALGGVERQVANVETRHVTSTCSGLRAGRDGCTPLRGCAGAFFFSLPFLKNSATRCQKVFFCVFAGSCGPRKRS